MPRRKVPRVAAIAAVAVLAAVAGFAWTALRAPSGPADIGARGPAVIRDPNSTVYIAPSGILFDVGSAVLRPEAIPTLRAIVADIARSHLKGTIRVEGYTDDVGTDDDNLVLSRDRAETVVAWLVEAADVDGSRTQVIAFGESSPALPNDSDAHRQANRRVVIVVER